MKSKIIQISTSTKKTFSGIFVFALCEDGSIWRKYGISGEWKLFSEPFQNEEITIPLPISGGQ